MPIIDVQRRLAEAGRIRAGQQVRTGNTRKDGKPSTRPAKLDTWRLTSRNHRALDAVAAIVGGEVAEWADAPTGDQFELITEVAELAVVLPPGQVAFSQWLELWSGGGCQRRCDGVHETISDGPCLCDPNKPQCTPHTRLSVMLAGAPTTGLWRVDTQGHYAKAELFGAMDLAGLLTKTTGRAVLPAILRLEHRKVIRDGKARQFVVPTLDFALDIAAIAAGDSAAPAVPPGTGGVTPPPALPAPGLTPVPGGTPSVADQIAAAGEAPPRPRRSNSPPLLPRTGRRPRRVASTEARQAVNGLLQHFPGSIRQGYIETLREEHGDESAWNAETWQVALAFLEGEVASVEGPGRVREPSPPASGPSADDAPAFVRDLHAKREAMAMPEETFRHVVSEATGGRTTSTRELTNREAAMVMRQLVTLEKERPR